VIEELALHDPDLEFSLDREPEHVLCGEKWGDYFGTAELDGDGDACWLKNYFIEDVELCARYALPFAANIEYWM
jgi:hypothetical protein